MKRLSFITLLIIILGGCYKPATPQEEAQQKLEVQQEVQRQIDYANHRIEITQKYLHMCDMNGGPKSIVNYRYHQEITCANGLVGSLYNE